MRKLLIFIVFIFLLAAGFYAASPYVALHQIQNAAEQKDFQTLGSYINFPKVQDSIKTQLKAELDSEINHTTEQNEFAMLGTMFAATLVDGLVEKIVTPQGLENLMSGQDVLQQLQMKKIQEPTEQSASDTDTQDWQFDTDYQSLNTLNVNVKKSDSTEAVTVQLERDGLFGWKIIGIELPKENTNDQP